MQDEGQQQLQEEEERQQEGEEEGKEKEEKERAKEHLRLQHRGGRRTKAGSAWLRLRTRP